MTLPIPFLAAAVALLAIVLFVLLRPLLRAGRGDAASRRAHNLAIYREQLRELEEDRAQGTLSADAYAEAERELKRRVLSETDGEGGEAAVADRPSRRTAIALLVILPLASAILYAWLGNTDAMKPGLGHKVDSGNLDAMVSALAARLEKNPDDLRGWAMLARSYKAMGKFDEAEKAFAKLGDALYTDASVLASYADLLAVRANGKIDGRPLQLVEKALELEPDHPMALSLAGTAAYDRKDFPKAIHYWERLLKALPPDSEDAKDVSAAVERLRRENGLDRVASAPGKAVKESSKAKPAAAPGAVSGRVELSKPAAGAVAPNHAVFIFARPAEGSRMPLAIKRLTVADLPTDFVLDDSTGMMGGAKLSEAAQVVIEVRVSKTGDAKANSGDWVGRSAVVKPGTTGIKIVVDQQLP